MQRYARFGCIICIMRGSAGLHEKVYGVDEKGWEQVRVGTGLDEKDETGGVFYQMRRR